LKKVKDIVGSVEMNEFVIVLGMGFSFVAGFWIGVDWYRKKIIQEAINDRRE
tara:strand:- start:2376 stop:2531 length:156 start_codon:yes stop_codon:yes gene_type:complete